MRFLKPVIGFSLFALSPWHAFASDISGTWAATIDTPMGEQHYTYELSVANGELTGTAKNANDNGVSALKNGKVNGDTVTFVETMNIQGMEIAVTYTGKIVSADEIDFTRQVGQFSTETLVAKRRSTQSH